MFFFESSEAWTEGNGLRQGSIWSPILNILHINDVVNTVSEAEDGYRLGGHSTNIVFHADGMIIRSTNFSALQQLLQKT